KGAARTAGGAITGRTGAMGGRAIGPRKPPTIGMARPPPTKPPPRAAVSTGATISPVAKMARKPAAIRLFIARTPPALSQPHPTPHQRSGGAVPQIANHGLVNAATPYRRRTGPSHRDWHPTLDWEPPPSWRAHLSLAARGKAVAYRLYGEHRCEWYSVQLP